jgi:hypothetical protein
LARSYYGNGSQAIGGWIGHLRRADELAQAGQVFCRDAAPYFAPRLTSVKVGGDNGAGPLKIELVSFKREDCLPARRSDQGD